MKQYRKKPIIIQAVKFETNNEPDDKNMNEICKIINQGSDLPAASHNGTSIFINTLEGVMRAEVGDYIIKGIKGEFYPCKPDIFEQTYEIV